MMSKVTTTKRRMAKKARISHVPTEHEEQIKLFSWAEGHFRAQLRLLYAIPNAGKRHINYAMKMKAEGLKSGVPDICLPVARYPYHGLYIELKRIKGGAVSSNQKEWIASIRQQGYEAIVCCGWAAAAYAITDYLDRDQWESDCITEDPKPKEPNP